MSETRKRASEQSGSEIGSDQKKKEQKSEAEEQFVNLELGDLSSFKVERIVSHQREELVDSIACLGSFAGHEGPALVLLKREKATQAEYESAIKHLQLAQKNQNTCYGFYDASVVHAAVPQRFDGTVIFPCQQWHIDKYSSQKKVLFEETPELYQAVTLPYIRSKPASMVKWLYQMLDKQAEQDRLLLEDTDKDIGFSLYAFEPAQDFTQHLTTDPTKLRALVLVNRRDLPSLRSLDASCLPLLQNIYSKVNTYLHSVFPLNPHSSHPEKAWRLFLHYKPTYFHLHVHVAHFESEILMRDRELLEVIENLQMDSLYYQKRTLCYTLGENDELYTRLRQFREREQAETEQPEQMKQSE